MQHHDEALRRYLARVRHRPEVVGVLLTGSLARGDERPDSDVDLVLVVTADEWRRSVDDLRVAVVETDGADYPGGYFDLKLMTVAMLQAVADHGDDPARSSLASARCVLDRGAGLDTLLARVREAATTPSPALVSSFVAQCRLHGEYFLDEGLRRGDPLLVAHAAVHLATSAARAVLAADGIAFPGPKQLLEALRGAPGAPAGMADALVQLVEGPGRDPADRVLGLVEGALGEALPQDASLARFVLENEYAWFTGVPAPESR